MNEPLPPQYYLDNFRFLIHWVNERYADLLAEEELLFIARFNRLAPNSQCLLVRMLGRKGPWFRATKLIYAEIDNHEFCANQLNDVNLIEIDPLLSITNLFKIFAKAELIQLFSEQLKSHKNARKEILLNILSARYPQSQLWSQWTNDQFGKLYYVDNHAIINTFLLLFFGNPYQNLTEFVLQDLGLYRYEKYIIDPQHRVFKNREELAQYQQLLLLREQLALAEDLNSLEQIVLQLPNTFASAAMERRRARLINQLAYEFERYKQFDLAMQLYQLVDLPPSRERQIRLLEKRGDHQQAWELLSLLIKTPMNEHELQIAERIAPRLAKKISEPFKKKSPLALCEKTLILPQAAEDAGLVLSVEEIVRLHLDTREEPCLYVENTLLNSLFGLWLWPEIFRGIQGAFANPLQSAPLDLYQEDFQKNRPDIQRLWQLFDDQKYATHIQNIWQQKHGIANHFVSWQFINETTLLMALRCIPATHLKLIFERLLFDLKTNRSGLPDLIQFFPKQQFYRMIEVKGPGDRLQDNQQRWLNFFKAHDIPAEVCYVSWQ